MPGSFAPGALRSQQLSAAIHQCFGGALQASVWPERAYGSPTPTFTRADATTCATFQDWEGRVNTALANEARFVGARRVRNQIKSSSENLGATGWSGTGGTSLAGNTVTFGAAATAAYLNVPTLDNGTANKVIVVTAQVRSVSGTQLFRIQSSQNGVADNFSSDLTATTTARRFSFAVTNAAGGTGAQTVGLANKSAGGAGGQVILDNIVLEDVTGQSNQNPSEYVSVGVLSAPFHGAGIDGVKFFTTLNGNVVASNVVAEAAGVLINPSNAKFARLPRVSGSYFSTPNAPANQITGDIDIRVQYAPDSLGVGYALVASRKDGLNPNCNFALAMSTSGAGLFDFVYGAGNYVTSTAAVSTAAGITTWARVTRVAATGVITFYESLNNQASWLQIGTPVAGIAGALQSTTSPLELGSQYSGTSIPFSGRIYRAQLFNVIGGVTPVVDFNSNNYASGSTWSSSTTGETYTINGSARVFGSTDATYGIAPPWDAQGPFGYWSEGASTQLVTPTVSIRNMTDVSWVKVTMTTAATSVGADGAANSATRLTATGATATILQTLIAASSSRTYSAFVRRVTGTGTIKLVQGVSKSADLSSLLNSSTYTQIQFNASVLNAAFGIEIGTNGDAIDVDLNQFEAGAFASSPIATASATRNADSLTFASDGNLKVLSPYTVSAEAQISLAASVQAVIASNQSYAPLLRLVGAVGSRPDFLSDTGVNASVGTGIVSTGVVHKLAGTFNGTQVVVYQDGAAGTPANVGAQTTEITTILVGGHGTWPLYGTIRNLRIFNQALTAGQVQLL